MDFLVHEEGRVRFEEFRWRGPWKEDGAEYEGYWEPGPISGYFASLDDAEKDALSEVPWLRNRPAAPDQDQ